MVLQQNRARVGRLGLPCTSFSFELIDGMDQFTVVQHGQASWHAFATVFVEACGCEVDVLGLTGERWQAHVHGRSLLLVQPAALIFDSLQTE